MSPLLSLTGITKHYPGVVALQDVGFTLEAGEVHCLVGENGAGKSTLIKILAGAIPKDEGNIAVDGAIVTFANTADSQRYGIGIIYQDFKLVPELSVTENIMLGHEPSGAFFIKKNELHRRAGLVLDQLDESLDLSAPVGRLSAAQQQMVEIARALSRKVRVLALDEPTASLTEHEQQTLFGVIRRLRSEGVGIIYISHRLEEIFEIGDSVTVLRDGQVVETAPVKDVDRKILIKWMVGRELEQEFPPSSHTIGDDILRLEGIDSPEVRAVSLSLRKGEVLGLAGLIGAGRTELARIVFGADPMTGGKILLERKEVRFSSPREAIDSGIALLTEDRNRYGLIGEMTVKENITLSTLKDFLTGPFIDRQKEGKAAETLAQQLRIRTPRLETPVEHLSGGNRQKVVLARWLRANAKVIIFDEPTAGIDVGVKYEIYTIIHKLVDDGIGVLIISSDLIELLGICDRIAVMAGGRITGELTKSEATQEKIMMLATAEAA